jgi:hypothetical protein
MAWCGDAITRIRGNSGLALSVSRSLYAVFPRARDVFAPPFEFFIPESVDGRLSGCIMRGSADETSAGLFEFFDSVRR